MTICGEIRFRSADFRRFLRQNIAEYGKNMAL
jgi:hypothetical protein